MNMDKLTTAATVAQAVAIALISVGMIPAGVGAGVIIVAQVFFGFFTNKESKK